MSTVKKSLGELTPDSQVVVDTDGGGSTVILDNTVTQTSENGVKSSGIWSFVVSRISALGNIFADKVHTHSTAQINGLADALAGKQGTLNTNQLAAVNSGITSTNVTKLNGISEGATNVTKSTVSNWGFLEKAWSELVAAFAPKTHQHANGDLTGLASWAKASSKPIYTAAEVGALPDTTAYVASVTQSDGVTTFTDSAGQEKKIEIVSPDSSGGFISDENKDKVPDCESVGMLLLERKLSGDITFGNWSHEGDDFKEINNYQVLEIYSYGLGYFYHLFDLTDRTQTISKLYSERQTTVNWADGIDNPKRIVSTRDLCAARSEVLGKNEIAADSAKVFGKTETQLKTSLFSSDGFNTAVDARIEAKGSGIKMDDGGPYVEI